MTEQEEIEEYGDKGIASADAKIPLFLILTYLILPFWGIFTLYYYWNGSVGWLDRGYWQQLQRAANTTFPQVNYIEVETQDEKEIQRKDAKVQSRKD